MDTSLPTILKGLFLEFCDCTTICPCWVNETPDEEHCSALYLWHFDPGCSIAGIDIGGRSMALASFHARRRGTQSVILADQAIPEPARELLLRSFSHAADGAGSPALDPLLSSALEGLRRLLGDVVQTAVAAIALSTHPDGSSELRVEVQDAHGHGTTLARAHYGDARMLDRNAQPRAQALSLQDTALHDELHLHGPVLVQAVQRFEFDVASLPGPPLVLTARSGMRARFDYTTA